MKKVFISVPMRGCTEETIRKEIETMHKIAEIIAGEELEVIHSFHPEWKGMNSIECLGKSISLMADADYFIQPEGCYDWKGCEIEKAVARNYKIPMLEVGVWMVCEEAMKFMNEEQQKYRASMICTDDIVK